MKRARSEDKLIKKAIAISSRINKKYPYSDYGRAYLKRGTEENLGRFGQSYKTASAEQKAMRQQMGYSGRGLYRGKGGYWMQRLFGAKKGGFLDSLGDAAATVTGSFVPGYDAMLRGATALAKGQGEYTVSNSLVSGAQNAFQVPTFAPSKDGASVIISHREYIRNLYAPSAAGDFVNEALSVNPGLEAVFPWLSQVAVNYEEYEMKQLMFTFRSTVSDFNSGTGQCGQVIIASQYNVAQEPFSDKLTMMSYDGAQSSKTTEHQIHGVECDPSKLSGSPGKYIRWQPLSQDNDIKEYDHAQFNIAIADIPSAFINQSIGELWVTYTVELRKPKLVVNRALSLDRDIAMLLSNGAGSKPLAFRAATEPLLGTLLQQDFVKYGRNNSIGVSFGPSGVLYTSFAVEGTRITFPAAYSGCIQMKVQVAFNTALGTTGVAQLGQNLNANCNIKLIRDNPNIDNNSVAGWTNIDISQFGAPATGLGPNRQITVTQLLHFDIQPVTQGIDNWVDIYMNYSGALPTNVAFVEVDIMEYNSSFRYKLNGTNDTLQLVDVSGNTVVFP